MFFTRAVTVTTEDIKFSKADPLNGKYVFLASGCSSCHIAQGSTDEYSLAGGQVFKTAFGSFVVPNVSNSVKAGIGGWKFNDFYTALKFGQSPDGQHYFPAFPYTAYSQMADQDVADLWAFWKTLPSVETQTEKHQLDFPFNIRRNVGLWKILYLDNGYYSSKNDRATYLVEALAHCAECHTSRDVFGGLQTSKWFRGAKNPSGTGRVPSIHPQDLMWSKDEIVEYLLSGFTPDYDVAGGSMALVVKNTARLTKSDRDLIADYLLSLPPS